MKPRTTALAGKFLFESKKGLRDCRGVTSLEYGLLAGVLVLVVLAGFANLARNVEAQFAVASSQFEQNLEPGTSLSTGRLVATIIPAAD